MRHRAIYPGNESFGAFRNWKQQSKTPKNGCILKQNLQGNRHKLYAFDEPTEAHFTYHILRSHSTRVLWVLCQLNRYLYVRDRYDGRFYEQVYFMKGNNLLDVSEMEILSTFHHKFEN